MTAYEQIANLLNSHNVAYKQHTHEPVHTIAEVEARLPFVQGKMLKTVAFRLKDGRFILAGLGGHDRIDYRKLAGHFGVNRRKIASLSPQEVEATLGFEVGGVGPFALQPNVVVLLDEQLAEMDTVYCGSGKNCITLEILFNDLLNMNGGQAVELGKKAGN